MQLPDARSREILDAIVALYVETGRPVSSGLVELYLKRAYSSATIRIVMKQLEERGMLEQPHTSAGRCPTDSGFRAHVDRFLGGWSLHRHETPRSLHTLARDDVRRAAGSQGQVKALALLLSKLTDNISIILGPNWETARAQRIELFPRGERRVLLVVILDSAPVQTGLVQLETDHPARVVADAAALLSERVSGHTVAEIRDGLLDNLDLVLTPATACAAGVMRAGRDLWRDLAAGEVELQGVANVLDEPEFREPEPLKDLIRIMESPRSLRRSLAHLCGTVQSDFGVWIGHENPVDRLRGFSVLTGRFELEGRPGVLAVLGPRRMAYVRAFHGIDVFRRATREFSAQPAN